MTVALNSPQPTGGDPLPADEQPIQPFQAPPEKPDPDRYGAPGAVPDKPDDDGKRPNDGDLDTGDAPGEIVEEIVQDAR